MNIIFYVSDTHCCGHIRGEELARVINTTHPNDNMIIKSDILKSDYAWANVMVFQRQSSPTILAKMRTAQSLGIKTIYDIDDDLLNMPKDLGGVEVAYNSKETQEGILSFVNCADAITACSMTLAKSLRTKCQTPIYVIKNGVSMSDWGVLSKVDDDKVKIGWMASLSHVSDANVVSSALRRVMEETDACLKFIGWIGEGCLPWIKDFNGRVEVQDWVEVNALPHYMNDMDIGIAPLVDTPFNAAKSSIKWIQYSAMGIPTVMSKMAPYEDVIDGNTGVFATTDDEWHDALKRLVMNKKERDRIGENARNEVIAHHTTETRAKEFMEICRRI